ncbi:hypothetical protein BJF85_08085 [Saccharomonospora sp. CUA-673]|nr:hypothetical protein BJF85_08085 [Saccharomonospora sp. CUA-673]
MIHRDRELLRNIARMNRQLGIVSADLIDENGDVAPIRLRRLADELREIAAVLAAAAAERERCV